MKTETLEPIKVLIPVVKTVLCCPTCKKRLATLQEGSGYYWCECGYQYTDRDKYSQWSRNQ